MFTVSFIIDYVKTRDFPGTNSEFSMEGLRGSIPPSVNVG